MFLSFEDFNPLLTTWRLATINVCILFYQSFVFQLAPIELRVELHTFFFFGSPALSNQFDMNTHLTGEWVCSGCLYLDVNLDQFSWLYTT